MRSILILAAIIFATRIVRAADECPNLAGTFSRGAMPDNEGLSAVIINQKTANGVTEYTITERWGKSRDDTNTYRADGVNYKVDKYFYRWHCRENKLVLFSGNYDGFGGFWNHFEATFSLTNNGMLDYKIERCFSPSYPSGRCDNSEFVFPRVR